MAEQAHTEQLTPLDLLMPGTYVQALLTFETSEPVSIVLPLLQKGLSSVVAQFPWISGRLVPVNSSPNYSSSLGIQWDASHSTPVLVDKGSIPSGYKALAAQGMLPKSIPPGVSPLNPQPAEETAATGAPIFAASVFNFSDARGVGLCVCVHHNAVDATGFTELLRSWARAMHGLLAGSESTDRTRLARITDALAPELEVASAQSLEKLWFSHPEHSKVAPVLPSEFAPCTCELFRISVPKIDKLKRQAEAQTTNSLTTTNIVTALMWQAVTRARAHRNPVIKEATSRLITAVNGRRRIDTEFSTPNDPYLGNTVLYSLAELPVTQLGGNISKLSEDCLADVCRVISESQSANQINKRSIAELCSLVSRVDDYRGIFVGWDLFSSRDFTVSSWNGLSLYDLDFGTILGKPQHVRPPYVEADGVGFVLPRKPLSADNAGLENAVEVMIMLRSDDMKMMMEDRFWTDLQC